MPNGLYDLYRQRALSAYDANAQVSWEDDTIDVYLIRASGGGAGPYYTRALATHDFLSDVPDNVDCRAAGPITLGTKTHAAGVADAADIVFPTVTAGDAIQELVCVKESGVETTSPLIFDIDTATGLPVTPGGGNVNGAWDNGANKIFKL